MPRKIAVVTGARSDYGLLYWLLKAVDAEPSLQLQLLVTGMHLAPEFGRTEQVIIDDGFTIAARVETLLTSDSGVGMAKSIGLGVIGFADALERLAPDLMVVLGDRFETFAAAQAAMSLSIPLAHIHGGEVTEGAMDEQIRHAISKMSHLHFVSAEVHRRRLLQMGENAKQVFMVGAPGLDHLAHLSLRDRPAMEKQLGIPLRRPTFLVTYHPATLGNLDPVLAFDHLAAALDSFTDATIVMTLPNADIGGRALMARVYDYERRNPGKVKAVASLGQLNYLSLLTLADVVIGNSSSGLIEAPAAGTPTVNVGPRQAGRLRGETVINCAEDKVEIEVAIKRAMAPKMQRLAAARPSLYGQPGHVASAIIDVLKTVPVEKLGAKVFCDREISV